jgi:copper chaperone CopZ
MAALLIFLLGRRLLKRQADTKSISPDNAHTMTIQVQGMTCNHCVNTVKNALEEVAGVEEAVPDLTTGTVLIQGENIDIKAILQAVKDSGYTTD